MDYQLRPSEPQDEDFLWRLNRLAYEEVVTAQFGSWDSAKQRGFFDLKWQTQAYFLIIADSAPVGAVTSAWSNDALTLQELLVLPTHQNMGIGTSVVQQLKKDARSRQLPLLLQVLRLNRARRL